MLFPSFLKSSSGNVAIMFALAAVVVIAGAGVAVDYSRKVDWETQLQSAVDGAALAAASAEDKNRKKVAKAYFESNFVHDDTVDVADFDLDVDSAAVTVRAKIDVKTSLMSVVGISEMKGSALGAASISDKSLEIALVLDVSGSMRHGLGGSATRIDVLKEAAQNLVDIVSGNGANMSKVKVGVVPFNMNVNVGTANAGIVKGTGDALFSGQPWAGCVLERAGTGATSDSYTGGNGVTGKWQAYVWPPEPNSAGTCTVPSNGTNSGYSRLDPDNGYVVGLQGPNYNCVRHPIMPLKNSYADVKAKISSLTAEWNMGTIIAPGVSWGMRVLSSSAPFTEGKPASSKVLKYMIVLTDGEQTTEAEYNAGKCSGASNTVTPYSYDPAKYGLSGRALTAAPKDMFSAYGYIWDSDPFGTAPQTWDDVRTDLFNISTSACKKAKGTKPSDATRIFTIAVSSDAGPGTTTYDLLNECASSKQDFFMATSASQLKEAFEAIANEIKDIRLVQ